MDSVKHLSSNLEYLKKSSKTFLKELKSGNQDSLDRFRKFSNIAASAVKLADIQHVVAQENSFTSWSKLKQSLSGAENANPNFNANDAFRRSLEALRQGRMCILFDDEGRENEGDFVMAAHRVGADHINFVTKYGRGSVCVAVAPDIAKRLDLQPQAVSNGSNDTPKFAQSLDAVDTNTGISSGERAETVRRIAHENSTSRDFRQPGHIATLIENKGGLKSRSGHTEGSVALMRAAGLPQAALICEIMNDDGTMARLSDLTLLAEKYDMPLLKISDIQLD